MAVPVLERGRYFFLESAKRFYRLAQKKLSPAFQNRNRHMLSKLVFSGDTFHLSFQQWVTHKGNYRPRSKTVTQLSASKFFGRKSKKSLPRPFLDVILCRELSPAFKKSIPSKCQEVFWKEVKEVPFKTLFRCNFVWGIQFWCQNGA